MAHCYLRFHSGLKSCKDYANQDDDIGKSNKSNCTTRLILWLHLKAQWNEKQSQTTMEKQTEH